MLSTFFGALSALPPGVVFAVALVATLACFVLFFLGEEDQAASPKAPAVLTFSAPRGTLTARDAHLCLAITLLYALTAFFRLGAVTAPQSNLDLAQTGTVELSLSQSVYIAGMDYFSALGTGAYNVEISLDGQDWSTLWPRKNDQGAVVGYYWADAQGYDPSYALSQGYNDLFKWNTLTFDNPQNVQYLRLTPQAERDTLQLCELVFYADGGRTERLDLSYTGSPLFDESDTAPVEISWYNSCYFDEIYHPRTALEHLENRAPYETTHPPLGKLLIGLGVRLFGMTPFGWRFMGTLFGVGMVPLLYVFLKQFFGRSLVAACGAILFATDFMHLTQTRIATIDTYAVFFILASCFFLYQWLSLPHGATVKQGALPLFLSGLTFGIGAACKWTVLYAGAGMALLYLLNLIFRWRDRKAHPGFWPWAAKTIVLSLIFFVAIPLVIYTLSYYPYAVYDGDTSLAGLIRVMWENQTHMLSYHQGVTASHPYASKWWMWLLDARPILYYMADTADAHTRFAAFLNPLLCWGGLLALGLVARTGWKRRDGKALFILVCYLAQLVPWIPISRPTFHYHYFPAVPFLVFALCYLFDDLARRQSRYWGRWVLGLTAGSAALYAAFYPVLIGLTIPTWYAALLRWLPAWPF